MEIEEDSEIEKFCSRSPNSDLSVEELIGHKILDVRRVITGNEDQWFCITCANGDKLLLTSDGDDYGSWIELHKYKGKEK